ncbi:Centromere/kinetochore Zw10-domain-containing protein [Umbelopsis sp. AD052]|nr:Centromere/kinetochore Zw10-domain-containing protein [Umbelopsis sp. AD052]
MADVFIESLISNAPGSVGSSATSLDRQELDALLDAIDRKTDSLEHMLFDTVKSSSDIFLNSWKDAHSTKSEVEVLLQDLDFLQREVYNDEDGIQIVVKSSLAEYGTIVDKVASNQNVIDSLELLVPIANQLKSVESQLRSGHLVQTQKQLEELETTVAERFGSGQWNRVNAAHVIRKQIQIVRTHLLEALENCIQRNITFSIQPRSVDEPSAAIDAIQMKVNYQFQSIDSSGTESDLAITLSQVFTCISDLGSLESYMAPLKKNVYRNVIVPLLEAPDRAWVVQVHQNSDGSATLDIKATRAKGESGDEDEVDPLRSVQNVDIVFDFFYNYMFGQSVQPKEQNLLFGNLIVPDTFELLKTYTLQPSIPSTIPKLNSYTEIANSVQTLEDKLIQFNFMANKDTASLSQFVNNIDRYFSLKLKGKILVNARRVMLRKIYDAEPTNDLGDGSQSTFVTQTPRLLLVLIQDTIDTAQQIAEQHPTSSTELWNAINELVDMYRALMPTFHGEAYTSDYSTAMLFRNDCYWLASHLTKLQSVNATKSQPLEISAQKLRQLGGIWYELTVRRVVSQVSHVLDRTEGFRNVTPDPRMAERTGQAVTDAVDLALRFSAMIQGVLSDDLFIQTITLISDEIIHRLISDIEEMHDIGDEESHIIARCLNSIMSLIDAFSRPGQPDATDSFVASHVKEWKKFWTLRTMLEMSFKDIMELFRDGELQSFETKELCDFLCSLFADTELRTANLQEIQRGYQSQKRTTSFNLPSASSHSNLLASNQRQSQTAWKPFDDTTMQDEPEDEGGWEPFDDHAAPDNEGWEPFDEQPISTQEPRGAQHAPDDQAVENKGSDLGKRSFDHQLSTAHTEGWNLSDHENEDDHASNDGWNLSDHEEEPYVAPTEEPGLHHQQHQADNTPPSEEWNKSESKAEMGQAPNEELELPEDQHAEGWNLSDNDEELEYTSNEGLILPDQPQAADDTHKEEWTVSDHEQELGDASNEGLVLPDQQQPTADVPTEGWNMSDHEAEDAPAEGWDLSDQEQETNHSPPAGQWEPHDAHIDKQARIDANDAHLKRIPESEAVKQPPQEEDESLWEPMDDPNSEDHEGWEAFGDDDTEPRHTFNNQGIESRHHNESPFASVLDQLSDKPASPKPSDSHEDNRRGDSFANLFGEMTGRASSPKQDHQIPRFGSPSIESSFSSLLGNIIGATPSPKPEQQAAKQASSGLGLPSLDAFGYASNRIAGEFTSVVGSMIGASSRPPQTHNAASPDRTSTPLHFESESSKPVLDHPKPKSKFDFVPQNTSDEPAGEEEGGWEDW